MRDDDLIDDTDDGTEGAPVEASPVTQLPDGIYLHLDEDIYHAQQRLSASGISKLMQSEADFWASSWLNPAYDDTPTEAQRLGRAFHSAKLEPELLDVKFVRDISKSDMPEGTLFTDGDVRDQIKARQPSPEDHPEALRTDTDVKAVLKEMGHPQSVKGETADDRKVRLRGVSAGVVFWQDILDEWEAQNGPIKEPENESPEDRARRLQSLGFKGKIWCLEREAFAETVNDRTVISADFWDQMQEDVADMATSELAAKHLKGGRSEVSILWTDAETGVMWKARIDYLRPDMHTDAKTFANPSRKPVEQCLKDAFRFNGYYRQGYIYHQAIEHVRSGAVILQDGVNDNDREFVAAVAGHPRFLECWYLFQQKGGVPNVFAMKSVYYMPAEGIEAASSGADEAVAQMMRDKYAEPTMLYIKARRDVSACTERFIDCMAEYGSAEKWRPLNPVGKFDDYSFPSFWLDETYNEGEISL